jgi:hypothetical protein
MFPVRCSFSNTAATVAQVTVVAIILSASGVALETACTSAKLRNLKSTSAWNVTLFPQIAVFRNNC